MPHPFQYLRDPLFLVALALLGVNQLLLKPQFATPFLHYHFNDLLLIPCALPPLLWIHRLLDLRATNLPPSGSEVILHLLVWCVLFEAAGPYLMNHATGDWRDVLAYCGGGLLAWSAWNTRLLIENESIALA